jgi:SAM-dependent methyltransferase
VHNFLRRLLFQYWYFRQPPWDTGVSPPELFEFLEKQEPGRAIDIGCGTGTNVITLARAGWRVTGVDFAPRAVKLARQKLKREGIQAELFVRDGIPQANRTHYLRQLDRILAPSGYWLMYGFLKPEGGTGTGLTESEIGWIAERLTLLSRRSGMDDGRAKPSAWFLFQKKP